MTAGLGFFDLCSDILSSLADHVAVKHREAWDVGKHQYGEKVVETEREIQLVWHAERQLLGSADFGYGLEENEQLTQNSQRIEQVEESVATP